MTIGIYQENMGSRFQPGALDDGRGGGGHAADDVRLAHRMFEVSHRMRLEAVMGQFGRERFALRSEGAGGDSRRRSKLV